MLGYDSKEDLLSRRVPDTVSTDHDERGNLIEEVERQPSPQGREINLLRKDGTPIVCFDTAASSATPPAAFSVIKAPFSTSPPAARWSASSTKSRSLPATSSTASPI